MNKVEIKNIHGEVIYTYEGENATIKDAVEDAVKKGVNLTRANLYRANLYGVNLYGANFFNTNLSQANLYGTKLENAKTE